MSDLAVFIFGSAVFTTYMVGLLWMVNKQHKIQAGERRKNEEAQADANDAVGSA